MYKQVVDEVLLKIIINTYDINTLFRNCEWNKDVNRVCRENQELIGKEFLRRRGYNNGSYSRLKRFFKVDSSLTPNIKNILKLYKLNDIDLLEMILDRNYMIMEVESFNKLNVHELANSILDVIYDKHNSSFGILFAMKLIQWDLFEDKQIPDKQVMQQLLQEHNSIFNTKYNLIEYSKLFQLQITKKIFFTDITSLETKISLMLQDWTYWMDNPIKD